VKRAVLAVLLLSACARRAERVETIPLDLTAQPPAPARAGPMAPAPVAPVTPLARTTRESCYAPETIEQFRVLADTLSAAGSVVVEGVRYGCLGKSRFEPLPSPPRMESVFARPAARKAMPSAPPAAPARPRRCYDARSETEVREYLPAARAGIGFEVGGVRYSCVNGPGRHVL
jgi:hypothetical protein